jgi:toxin ParE1/3/4
MSVRRAKVVLKPAARGDVRSILLSTGQRCGFAQRDAYREALDQAFTTLSVNPLICRSRDEIAPNLRSHTIQQHVIYDRVEVETVTVLRILHGKMDATRHVEEI